MNEIVMFYHSENGRWFKTWAENHGGEVGVIVKSLRISASEIDISRLRTADQANLTPAQLLDTAKKLY
jgi:hypothetical protein